MIITNKRKMNKEVFNNRQKRIRDIEWNAIENEVKHNKGRFLDVGAGTGYALSKAESLGFQTHGVEPQINVHGVNDKNLEKTLEKIIFGRAESLPFEDKYFNIIYASHSLEHFQNTNKGLSEMLRVLDDNGRVIIIVPTGIMSFINLISQYLFRSHKRVGRFIFKERSISNLRNIFFPNAHGSQNVTLFGEMFDFRVVSWKKRIQMYFTIDKTILPCLYPFPDFPQFFPFIINSHLSSSVIFVCSKKKDE